MIALVVDDSSRSGPPLSTPGHSNTDHRPPRRAPLGDLEPRARFSLVYYLALLAGFFLLQSIFFSGVDVPEMSYRDFRNHLAADEIDQLILTEDRLYGELRSEAPPAHGEKSRNAAAPSGSQAGSQQKGRDETASEPRSLDLPAPRAPWHIGRVMDGLRSMRGDFERELAAREATAKRTFTVIRLEDPKLLADLQRHGVDYRGRIDSHWLQNLLLNWIVPFAVMFVLWGYVMRRMGGGPNVLRMGQSHAKIYEVDPATRVHFTDLAGVDEAIEETREIVSFLKDPARFTRLGAKLPKGVLLVGPPGTGKTLLARAIAGESEVPFFSLSGSDFVEMFVGVGAARVRDLFQEAKKTAPCIIFIDELDAIGKSRSQAGPMLQGGYDERENTLNQLLVEMDGFDASAGVVLLAATNRPDVLDAALLRPGRFDRRVLVDRPSRAGREAIFRIHTRKLPLGDDIDLAVLAAQTPGMVGADIANVCNEAALMATRAGRTRVGMEDFQEGIERSIAGPQKKSRIVTPEERRRIAYHESGHALVGHMTPGGDPVQKISIIPRSAGALGYTIQMPLEDRYLLSKEELLDHVRVMLAGRAAESVVFGDVSTGASDDLEKANEIVRQMLTVYGMSEKAPNLSLTAGSGAGFLAQPFGAAPHSEALARDLDTETVAILARAYDEARSLIVGERDRLEQLAKRLLETEELDREMVLSILGARPETSSWGAAHLASKTDPG
jgi:cell division protease FtsH